MTFQPYPQDASSHLLDAGFPFFGAGQAHYYEWAELAVRFQRVPSAEEQALILRHVPPPLQPDAEDGPFWGRMLRLGSEQFVNMHIQSTYGNELPGEGDGDEDADDDDFLYQASTEAVEKFNADIETWLRKAHAICPIEFACRDEDAEAGGTELSDWHEQSLKVLDGLLLKWAADPGLRVPRWTSDPQAMPPEEFECFRHCVKVIVDLAQIDLGHVPASLVALCLPERQLMQWLRDPAVPVSQALAFHDAQRDASLNRVLSEAIQLLVQSGHPQRACDIIEHVLDHPDFLFELSVRLSVSRIAQAVLVADRPALQARLVARLSGHDGPAGHDSHSSNYTNDIAARAATLMQSGEWTLAIRMFDLALSIESPRPPRQRLEAYCNALYAAQNDNSKLPVDAELNHRFLAKTLPFGPHNPAIYFNAACLYVEMNEFDEAAKMVTLAVQHRYNGLAQMKSQIDELPMFASFRQHPAYLALRFKP